jgi:phosphoglycolate phosphatase-like HAD superfamily hydrolase
VSAKRASLPVIAVAHSYGRADLEASEADLVLDRLADIDEEKIFALYAKLYA